MAWRRAQDHSGREGHDHAAHGEGDPCNAQPAWSIHVKGGAIQSIVSHLGQPVSVEVVERLGLRPSGQSLISAIYFRAWEVRNGQALIAIGVDPVRRTAGQWVLIRRALIPSVYPEPAKLLGAAE